MNAVLIALGIAGLLGVASAARRRSPSGKQARRDPDRDGGWSAWGDGGSDAGCDGGDGGGGCD